MLGYYLYHKDMNVQLKIFCIVLFEMLGLAIMYKVFCSTEAQAAQTIILLTILISIILFIKIKNLR
jgi:hypothetical protein